MRAYAAVQVHTTPTKGLGVVNVQLQIRVAEDANELQNILDEQSKEFLKKELKAELVLENFIELTPKWAEAAFPNRALKLLERVLEHPLAFIPRHLRLEAQALCKKE